MTLSPYSYLAAPAELYYAAFNSADINPRHLATSKTHFSTVLELVVQRCQQISRQQLVLHWHHCLQHVYAYLNFKKL